METLHQTEEGDSTDVVGTKIVHNVVTCCTDSLANVMARRIGRPDLDTSTKPKDPKAQTLGDQFRTLLKHTARILH